MKKIFLIGKGVSLVLFISFVSFILGQYFPVIGGAGFGIIIGMITAYFFKNIKSFESGIDFSAKTILHISIVLLGATVNIGCVLSTALESFPLLVLSISVSFIISNIVGKMFGLNFNMRNLIGAGTGICGGSAIAALSSIIKPSEKEISYSLSIIFLFNIIAVFTFPIIGHFFHMSQHFFGMFAGSAINDTSSVVAAGYIFGEEAGKYAVTVKLTRTLAIIPVILIFSAITAKTKENSNRIKSFPWFITWFMIIVGINSLLVFTDGNIYLLLNKLMKLLGETGKFLIITAISAIGLKTDLKKMINSGIKPLLTGLITWLGVTLTVLISQKIFM